MQNTSRIFALIGRPLHSALASSLILIPVCIGTSLPAAAQEAVQGAELATAAAGLISPIVPQQVRYASKMATCAGDTVETVFHIYASEQGGEPLWTETQKVTVAEDGSYSVLLGGATPSGLPQTVFAGGAARWLGISVERSPEQERVLLSSVPYAMKSADAESLSGHAASDFVTQSQLAQFATQSSQQAIAAPEVQPLTSGAVTGSGTAGTVPLWTGALTQGNSEITQVGSNIGINKAVPSATLDVGGSATVEGVLTVPAQATATTSAGFRSQLLDFTDSAWSTKTKAPIAQTWRLYATDAGNNTANPTSTLNFQFQNGAGAATPIVLSIAQTGVISFAPTQTFPGTIASVTGTSPVTATTNSGAVSLGLNTTALETALNSVYAQLGTSNAFAGEVLAHQATGISYSALVGMGTNGSMGAYGQSDSGYGVKGVSNTGSGVYGTSSGSGSGGYFLNSSTSSPALYAENDAFGNGVVGVSPDGTGVVGKTHGGSNKGKALGPNSAWGVWGDTAVAGESSAGVLGTADDGYAGLFESNGADTPTINVINDGQNSAALLQGASSILPTLYVSNSGGSEAAQMDNYSSMYSTLYLNNGAGGPTTNHATRTTGPANGALFRTLMASTPTGTCGIGGNGDLSCTGQVKSLVSTNSGARTVETYAMQSPENWMEDFGSGELQNGVATVTIEAAFAETVSADSSYHVFITPNGDSKGLYVIRKTATSFEVRESGGGTSNLSFDYRIVAKRRGYEAQRLTDVTDRLKSEMARASSPKATGIPHSSALPTDSPKNIHTAAEKMAIPKGPATRP